MGRDTDFHFGYNVLDPPGYSVCMQRMERPRCGKFHGYCSELQKAASEPTALGRKGQLMDLTAHRSKDTRKSSKSRPFLKTNEIPEKGGDYTIEDLRQAPKNM